MRRRDVLSNRLSFLPGAVWRDAGKAATWAAEFDRTRPIVAACKAGHEMSQRAVAQLRADGLDARVLEGGYQAWRAAGLPAVAKAELDRIAPDAAKSLGDAAAAENRPHRLPWLVRRFLDPQARILFVDPDMVVEVARESGGIPFDIKDIELSHDGERCTFDTMLKLFGLESEPSLARLALIVRGADTARPDLAPEAAGLHAVSLGLSALAGDDDHGLLATRLRSSMMHCSPGCALPPTNGTTGLPKRLIGDGNHGRPAQSRRIDADITHRPSPKRSRSGSRSAASRSADRPARSR